MKKVFLKPFREKSVLKRHPWIFSGAIEKIQGSPSPGETVLILNYKNELLGLGSYSPKSQIAVRIWTYNPEERVGEEFFFKRIEKAFRLRKDLNIDDYTNAYRIVNSESDGLPGVIIDYYDNLLVCQFLSAGAEYWKKEIVSALKEIFPQSSIFERSDVLVRQKEGLELKKGILVGKNPPDRIKIREGDLFFWVDIKNGHKTGFYLDQRENRKETSVYFSDKKVLNCFSYTGGFGIVALKSEAKEVINIDCSAKILELAKENFILNSLNLDKTIFLKGNVFKLLRYFRDKGEEFDVIVLDPPKLIHSQSTFNRGLAGYKDINLLAIKLLKPGGILITFSCSGLLQPSMFQKVISDASIDAKREVKIVKRLSMPPDHVVDVNFPEGFYLKGFVCKVF